jgi:recombination protein RecA
MTETSSEPKSLARLIASINKTAGEKVIGLAKDWDNIQIERLTTGFKNLDEALGGGFPIGRTIELYGPPSSGKSLISMLTVAQAQKEGKSCIYFDIEDSFSPEFAELLGVNVDKLVIVNLSIGEKIMDVACKLLEAEPDLMVIDSVAAMILQDVADESLDKQFMALKARLMSKALSKLTALNKKTTLIFINQTIATMAMYGPKTTTPGGNALKFYASLRLEVKTSELIYEDDKKTKPVIGQVVNFRVTKNKTASPFKVGAFRFYYDTGKIEEPKKKNEVLS